MNLKQAIILRDKLNDVQAYQELGEAGQVVVALDVYNESIDISANDKVITLGLEETKQLRKYLNKLFKE